jgi:coenzyme F420 hydrogenase subunit beta
MDYATSWGTILNKHLQFRCKLCPDGTGEQADIVCADAWFGKDGYPDFSEKDGRSLIISRTTTGEQWVKSSIQAGDIEVADFDLEKLALMQPYQKGRKEGLYARLLAMRLMLQRVPRYEGLRLSACSRRLAADSFLKNFLGMSWRIIKRCRQGK